MAVASEAKPPAPSQGGASSRGALGSGALRLLRGFLTLREGSIVVVTLVTFAYFAITTDQFLTSGNFQNLLPFFAPFAIMAAGEAFVMILGEIDLSIGAMYLFTPFLWDKLNSAGLGLVPSMIVAVLIVTGLGALNGFFVAYVGIASFVATLGMLFILYGLTLVISHATAIVPPGTSVTHVGTFAQIFGAGTYSELFWALGVVIVLQLALSFTRWGLYTIAVGGNRHAAAEAGIRVRLVIIRNFALSAGLAGFVGVLEAVRSASANPDPSSAGQILLEVVAAVIIGGTLMTGGEGTIIGALIGALFLGILGDGLNVKGVSDNYLNLYLGIAILIAMVINVFVRRVRTGSGIG